MVPYLQFCSVFYKGWLTSHQLLWCQETPLHNHPQSMTSQQSSSLFKPSPVAIHETHATYSPSPSPTHLQTACCPPFHSSALNTCGQLGCSRDQPVHHAHGLLVQRSSLACFIRDTREICRTMCHSLLHQGPPVWVAWKQRAARGGPSSGDCSTAAMPRPHSTPARKIQLLVVMGLGPPPSAVNLQFVRWWRRVEEQVCCNPHKVQLLRSHK